MDSAMDLLFHSFLATVHIVNLLQFHRLEHQIVHRPANCRGSHGDLSRHAGFSNPRGRQSLLCEFSFRLPRPHPEPTRDQTFVGAAARSTLILFFLFLIQVCGCDREQGLFVMLDRSCWS